MKIDVCIKHVPDSAAAIFSDRIDESVQFVMNPYDEIAVEQALRTKESAGGNAEVVVFSMGREGAVGSLRQALAMGADRAVLIRTDEDAAPILTARALAAAILSDGKPDLVFGGKQSIDSEGMQTLYRLAAVLDFPVVSDVVAFSLEGDCAVVEREGEAGAREVFETELPCVIGAAKGLNVPRYTKLMEIMKAKKKEIRRVELETLSIEKPAGRIEVLSAKAIVEKRRKKVLKGDPQEAVRELVRLLKEEARVL